MSHLQQLVLPAGLAGSADLRPVCLRLSGIEEGSRQSSRRDTYSCWYLLQGRLSEEKTGGGCRF
jgi:hypothetical protein